MKNFTVNTASDYVAPENITIIRRGNEEGFSIQIGGNIMDGGEYFTIYFGESKIEVEINSLGAGAQFTVPRKGYQKALRGKITTGFEGGSAPSGPSYHSNSFKLGPEWRRIVAKLITVCTNPEIAVCRKCHRKFIGRTACQVCYPEYVSEKGIRELIIERTGDIAVIETSSWDKSRRTGLYKARVSPSRRYDFSDGWPGKDKGPINNGSFDVEERMTLHQKIVPATPKYVDPRRVYGTPPSAWKKTGGTPWQIDTGFFVPLINSKTGMAGFTDISIAQGEKRGFRNPS